MTDVPPNGEPDGEDAPGARSGPPAYPDPPPPGPPPAFDDDALAAALEADMAPYTQPIPLIRPGNSVPQTPPTPPPPAPEVPVAAAPAEQPPFPYVEPEPEYLPPDVPEYVVPPAPTVPEYVEPPAPTVTPPIPPFEDGQGPTTLDAIDRLEEQLRIRELGPPPVAPQHPVEQPAPVEPPQAQPPAPVEPPPLVEPKTYDVTPQEPEPTAPPTQKARLEDVQGLPPPIGMTAAPIPPYDPNAPIAPLDPFAVPPVSPAEFAGTYGTAVESPNVPPRPVEDSDDDVDEIDRVFGAPTPSNLPSGDEISQPPSQPIATRRLRQGDAALVGEKPENHPAFMIETAGAEATALDLRAARAGRLFWLWFATNSSIISMALGAVLFTVGMSLRQAIVAALTGVALSFLPLGLGTLAGKWSGQPTMVVSRASFGHLGNIAPALVAVLVRVFWGGALLWLLSISSANLLVFAGLDAGLGESVWTYLFLGVGFVIATLIAVFGYGLVARLQLVASILSGLLIVGVIVLTYPRLNISAALSTGDGPWILVVGGAVIVFSFVGLAWVQSSSDLARYQRPTSSGAATMLSASLGATLPPFILITWGAMLAASDPGLAAGLSESPLTSIAELLPLWYPAPLLTAAGLGLMSGVVLTIYSGGFALQAIGLRMPRFAAVIVAALLVAVAAAVLVLLAADANAIVRDLATTLAVPVAAWAGIFAAEMMIRTRQFDSASLLAPGGVYPRVRVVNLIAFLLITAIGLGLSSATFPGLTWQGFLWPLIGVAPAGALATSDVGVLIALVLGIIVPLATAIPAIRRQEMDSLKATPTGSIPRVTGSVPRVTGSVPRVTGSAPQVPPPSIPEQAPTPSDPLLDWGRDPDPR